MDMLVKLYELKADPELNARIAEQGITIRRVLAPELNELIGFACHEATAKGFFGPTGVDTVARGKGVGQALLLTTLLDMYAQGYAYGVIGGAGPMEFYRRSVGAVPIEGSEPGIYRGMLPLAEPKGISESGH
jgi:GNAT superfamily N-acetyltransferase